MKRRIAREYTRLQWHKIGTGSWNEYLDLPISTRFLLMDETDDLIDRHNEQVESSRPDDED